MQDVLRVNSSGDLTVEWNFLEKDLPGVVLHDRLMTDAALGHRPIKSEHSYSLNSDGDSLPDSPISSQKMDGKNLYYCSLLHYSLVLSILHISSLDYLL